MPILLSPDKDATLRGYACSKSTSYDTSKPPPCLLQIADQGFFPVFGVGSGVVYTWLIRFSSSSLITAMKSHRAECSTSVRIYFLSIVDRDLPCMY